MTKPLVALSIAIIVVLTSSCGGALVNTCGQQTKAYLEKIKGPSDEFVDTNKIAASTARIALPSVIKDMQAQVRQIKEITPPECAKDDAEKLVDGMNMIIDGYLEFMSSDSGSDTKAGTYIMDGAMMISEARESLVALSEK